MRNIQTILDFFNLSLSDIDRLKIESREVAINCGKSHNAKKLKPETWDLFSDISDYVWFTEDLIDAARLQMGFNIYEIFPNYYHFLVPIYYAVKENLLETPKLKDMIWRKFMSYLSSENYYADPVSYILWVDFFENSKTVDEAWYGLMQFTNEETALLRLLHCIGPVPYNLKETLYLNLIQKTKNHSKILTSLLLSTTDVFGSIDKTKAELLLSKLQVNKESEEYKILKENLKKCKVL